MAGAGTKLFIDGEILDAAEVNTYLQDQVIMRFANAATRDAAFGGVGEPVLAEGMFCYLDDTNTLQSYNGSAWVNVVSSSTPPGLEYITSTSASAASTLAIDGCFTSTYAHYLITYNLTSSLTGQYTGFRLRAGNTPKAVNYDRVGFFTTVGGVSGVDGWGTAQTEHYLGGQSTGMLVGSLYVYNPQVSGRTGFAGTASYPGLYQSNGAQTETYSADGFQIFASGNAATYTGTIRVYGYRNS